MKEQAKNLRCGSIYTTRNNNKPSRLVSMWPSIGVWLEYADGSSVNDADKETGPNDDFWARVSRRPITKFEDVYYASQEEVDSFLTEFRAVREAKRNEVTRNFPSLPPLPHPIESTLNE